MASALTPDDLREAARRVRRMVLETAVASGRGHLGSALSCVDILVALYHGEILKVLPGSSASEMRDRFILSKGHASLALYAVLADRGFFPGLWLPRFGKPGTLLSEHPTRDIPGVETVSGSLGHGLGIGVGMALAARLSGQTWRTYVLLGDGECGEGSIWEAAALAGALGLNNLTAIVDCNGYSAVGIAEGSLTLRRKFAAFDWDATVIDGHDLETLPPLLNSSIGNAPFVILTETIKGKGIPFMEETGWHHGVLTDQQAAWAREYLA